MKKCLKQFLFWKYFEHDFDLVDIKEDVKIIGENWHKFKDDERINNGLLRQIETLKAQVNSLQQKINDAENALN
jgi:hypothetical protein